MNEQERIFVQVASYRDADCPWTIKDMFDTAAKPERVFAGVCWQSIPEEDPVFLVEGPRSEQVRKVEFHANESKGVCWARHQTQKLWRAEEYTMQIDSHMRFEKHWDEKLIAMIRQCPGDHAVLTTYPMGFTPPREITGAGMVTKIVAKEFDTHRILIFGNISVPEGEAPAKPMLGAFLGGCFFFGPSSIIPAVPYDPDLYFFGEEASVGARLWTHGYDLYAPNRAVIYHDWSRQGRRLHWDDSSEWGRLTERAYARVRHLFGTERSTDPAVLRDLDAYGFGTERSLADYERFTGISFRDCTISDRAKSFYFPYLTKEEGQATAIARPGAAATAPRPTAAPGQPPAAAPTAAAVAAPAIIPPSNHKPRKVLETDQIIVYDEFVAPHLFEQVQAWAINQDYYHINTVGTLNKTWRLHDGFPLRSVANVYFNAGTPRDATKNGAYPSNTAFDLMVEQIMRTMPEVKHLVGEGQKDWNHFSASSFLYPRGTGLSMHHDGNNVYSGAYTYFVSPVWNIHWGGLLMVFDKRMIIPQHYVDLHGVGNVWKPIWIDQEYEMALSFEPGIATCILPLPNRMVFIEPTAYHMITTVTASAGDHVRMAWSGFFTR
jgi:hypothetical protein